MLLKGNVLFYSNECTLALGDGLISTHFYPTPFMWLLYQEVTLMVWNY